MIVIVTLGDAFDPYRVILRGVPNISSPCEWDDQNIRDTSQCHPVKFNSIANCSPHNNHSHVPTLLKPIESKFNIKPVMGAIIAGLLRHIAR